MRLSIRSCLHLGLVLSLFIKVTKAFTPLTSSSIHSCSILKRDPSYHKALAPTNGGHSTCSILKRDPSCHKALAPTNGDHSTSSSIHYVTYHDMKDESSTTESSLWYRLASSLSRSFSREGYQADVEKMKVSLITLLRVGVPSIVAGVAAFFAFPLIAVFLASILNDAGVFAVLSQDSSQFIQNFLTVSGLLFSILIGQTYAFLYQQQEAVFYALFNEVTEAKSLLEQVALVCQGRAMYGKVLESISKYVRDDLKQLQADPAILISSRPVDDPLESIMYMTSVGVPSSVYETVKSLRQARAARLGALQRKLPSLHMTLLWLLAGIEVISFPLLGAGTQTIGGYNILTVEGTLFGIMVFGIFVTMRVIGELYRPGGGAYNVDSVLNVMVKGLEEELKERLTGGRKYVSNALRPSTQYETLEGPDDGSVVSLSVSPAVTPSTRPELGVLRQGMSGESIFRNVKSIGQWIRQRRNRSKSLVD